MDSELATLVDSRLEARVLGAAMARPSEALEWSLTLDCFEAQAHRTIFLAWEEAVKAGNGDLGGVSRVLRTEGVFERLGGFEGLARDYPATGDEHDAQALRSLTRRRRAYVRLRELQESAAGGDEAQLIREVSELATELADVPGAGRVYDVDALIRASMARFQARDPNSIVRVSLDEMRGAIGDLPVGSMVVLGADTNVGKSSIALSWLYETAKSGQSCGYVSLEDGPDVFGARLVSRMSGVSSLKMIRGDLSRQDWASVGQAVEQRGDLSGSLLSEHPIGGTDVEVRAAMTRLANRGCRLVMVDYIQAVNGSRKAQDRRNEIREMGSALKAHAARLRVALVLVSQLSRPPKAEPNREPTKHDLKEAGDLENAAEVVIVAWRDSHDDGAVLHLKADKVKWGNVGARWDMRRSPKLGGCLEEVRPWNS